MEQELAGAIDVLYRAFDGYGRPAWIEACACCWCGEPVEDTDRFGARGTVRVLGPGATRSLRELDIDDLAHIAAEVPLTAGDTAVFKHYLPRVLEIAVTAGFDWPAMEAVFGHLSFDDGARVVAWTGWPAEERAAIRSFMRAAWRDRLSVDEDEDGDAADTLLCSISRAEIDIDWYLDEWLRFEHPAAAGHLRRFLDLNAEDLARGALWNAFWDDPATGGNAAAVVAWALDPRTRAAV